MFLDYFALGLIAFVAIFLFYGIIVLHDIPYEIARKRNHPHQDAIHVAGWVSLFTLHTIWPFLWIWSTLYQPGRGWGFHHPHDEGDQENDNIAALQEQVATLSAEVKKLSQDIQVSSTKKMEH